MKAEERTELTLNQNQNAGPAIDVLKLRMDKADAKVIHADTFRQRNMNYALVTFGGLIGLRANVSDQTNQIVISTTLLVIMLVFCVWDRKWHRVKHGWDAISKECFRHIVDLTNDPMKETRFYLYDEKPEEEAEWTSWQPVVFYLLVLGSVASFFIKVPV